MSRTVIRRLANLEKVLPQQDDPWHQLIVDQGEDADARIADLIASGRAKDGDWFIVRQIVRSKHETPASNGGSLIE